MYVTGGKDIDEETIEILKEELNVKHVICGKEAEKYVDYEIKPQLKTLGPKYGSLLGEIRKFLANCNAVEVVNTVKQGKPYVAEFNGKQVEFSESDLLIGSKNKEGFVASGDGVFTVVLDTNLTEELVSEGIMREIVSKIQTMRKENDFVVTDHIAVSVEGDEQVLCAVNRFKDDIARDTLCDKLTFDGDGEFKKQWDVNGHDAVIAIKKI